MGSSLSTSGWAQTKSTTRHTSPTVLALQTQREGALSVAFATTPDGALMGAGASGQRALELGPVSYGAGSQGTNVHIRRFSDRFVVTAKFGLSIQDDSKRHGSASVLACLAYPETGYVLRLDGVRLSRTPQMISGQSPLGTVSHRLEIEVPTSLTEKDSQIRNAIIFQIIPN